MVSFSDVNVVHWINSHGLLCLVIYYFLASATGSLPAPTATSSAMYVYLFKFLNTFGASIFRAVSTRIESSPNWQPALQKAADLKGTPQKP